MLGFITKLFGTRSSRVLKKLQPYVVEVNKFYEEFHKHTNEDLRYETVKLKNHIKKELKVIDNEINNIKEKAEKETDLDKKSNLFEELDKLKKKYNQELEIVLNSILTKAFAIVKETARRFKENAEIEVKAEDFDIDLSSKREHITIKEDKAIWKNTWEAGKTPITWDMIHYDVQIIGGVILHQGKIAEMATGEGKTLVSTLPAFLNALSGKGVHIITVNDYLAKRDSEWNRPIFEFHGLTVSCIDKTEPHSSERKKAYNSDITYGTNNEFGFDYLRDNMADEFSELVQREHHFAMIDEVDSVLIDDARTPLIISGPSAKSNEQEYFELKPRIQKLYEAQKQLVTKYLQEGRKNITENKTDEGGLSLFRAYRGLPKYRPLIKYLSETGIKQILQKTENIYIQDNARMMPEADEPLLFTIDEKTNNIELTDKGLEYITNEGEDTEFFVLPDMGYQISKIDNDESLNEESKFEKKEILTIEYNQKNQRIHTTTQLLKAYALFEKDVEYIVQGNKVKIVDEQTGRVLEGRRYSAGLHQAIEAKENVHIQRSSQTYATVTLQNYFRMYHKLSGMTGTAETESGEFWEIYKLDVVVAPTNRQIIRDDKDDKVYRTVREKFNAIIDEIVDLTKHGRPVLAGTTSVEISELLSKMLTIRKIKHQVLNAKQHQKEAEIVAEAGKSGTVTIATNMAGRGTDIKLTPESKEAGGLAIIGTERHESRRVDRQLRGRSGRQGDPGSSQFFISLEDNLMRLFGSDRIAKIMDKLGLEEGEVIQHSMITNSIERAQKKVEENSFSHRKRLLEYDDVMNIQREVIYKRRRNALFGERLSLDIMNMIADTSRSIVGESKNINNYDTYKLDIFKTFGFETKIKDDEFRKLNEAELTQKIYEEADKYYESKKNKIINKLTPVLNEIWEKQGEHLETISIPVSDGIKEKHLSINLKSAKESNGQIIIDLLERTVILELIDQYWKEHLQDMDDLRQSVQNAVYEQKDPLLIYKFESFTLFGEFVNKINRAIISYLFRSYIPNLDEKNFEKINSSSNKNDTTNVKESKQAIYSMLNDLNEDMSAPVIEPVKSKKIAGRNERVSVRYEDGTIKEKVKFKTIEEDLNSGKCVVIE